MYIPHNTAQILRHIQYQLNQLQNEALPKVSVVVGSPYPHGYILVFSGSFNPPTTAHLALFKQAQHFACQQQSMHIYAGFSTHTTDKETVTRPLLLDRILLLKRLLQTHLPHAGILLFNRGLYIEQAEAIWRTFSCVKRIFFLMGFDKIVQILDSHYYEDRDAVLFALFKRAVLLVAPRDNAGEQELTQLLQKPENAKFAQSIAMLPLDPAYRAISSTQARLESKQAAASAVDFVPQEVRRFMHETRAYALPVQRADGSLVDCYEERVKYLSKMLGCPIL